MGGKKSLFKKNVFVNYISLDYFSLFSTSLRDTTNTGRFISPPTPQFRVFIPPPPRRFGTVACSHTLQACVVQSAAAWRNIKRNPGGMLFYAPTLLSLQLSGPKLLKGPQSYFSHCRSFPHDANSTPPPRQQRCTCAPGKKEGGGEKKKQQQAGYF